MIDFPDEFKAFLVGLRADIRIQLPQNFVVIISEDHRRVIVYKIIGRFNRDIIRIGIENMKFVVEKETTDNKWQVINTIPIEEPHCIEHTVAFVARLAIYL